MKNVKLLSALVLSLGVAVGAWGYFSLHKVQTQYSVRQFLPDHHPSYARDDKIQSQFQLPERPSFFSVVRLKASATGTLLEKDRADRFRAATKKIAALPGVRRALSLATIEGAFDDGKALSVGGLMENTAEAKWAPQFLADPLLSPTLITPDARAASVLIEVNEMSMDAMRFVQTSARSYLSEALPEAVVEMGGAPAIQGDFAALLNKELGLFVGLSTLVCALTILLIFRNFSAIFLPFALNILCDLAVLGWMAAAGIPFTVMSTTVPIMIFVTVITMCTHLMLRVNEELRENKGLSQLDAVIRANKDLFVPNFLGPLTTLLGFVTLFVNDTPLMRQYGSTVVGAVAISWLVTQVMVIPMLILFPAPKPRQWTQKKATWLFPILKRHRGIVYGVTLASLALAVGGFNMKWTAQVFDDLPEGQEARRATYAVDKELGGAIPLDIVITGSTADFWNDPAELGKLDAFLKQVRTYPAVGTALGLPEFLKATGKGALPTTRAATAEMIFLYSFADASPLVNYLTADGKTTRLSLRLHDIPANELRAAVARISADAKTLFPREEIQVGGMATTVHEINDGLSQGLIFDFWQALIITSLTLILVFRSWRWALVACLPNIVPPIALLGFLGATGTPIKPVVAMIFSVVLGLAFGNTVYMLNRLRAMQKEMNGFLPFKQAFYLEGNPCLISTLIVASGFSVFLFSEFSVNVTFGMYILISVAAGVVGDVMYLPAFLKWWPEFLALSPRAKASLHSGNDSGDSSGDDSGESEMEQAA